jgi:hypothetical protein
VQIAKSKNKTEKRFANTILEEVSKLWIIEMGKQFLQFVMHSVDIRRYDFL